MDNIQCYKYYYCRAENAIIYSGLRSSLGFYFLVYRARLYRTILHGGTLRRDFKVDDANESENKWRSLKNEHKSRNRSNN